MAITIKKSALTLKRPAEAESPAAPHLTSGPVLSAGGEPAPAWTAYAICALIGMCFLIGLLVLQYVEYEHYQDAFPLRVPQAAATAAQPAEAGAPAAAKPAEVTEPAAAKPEETGEPAAAKPAAEEPAAPAPAEKAAEPAAESPPPVAEPAAVAEPQV